MADDGKTDTTAEPEKTDPQSLEIADKSEPEDPDKQEPIPFWCRCAFEIILIWLAFLLLLWDVAVPIGIQKTIKFADSYDLADGCPAFARLYNGTHYPEDADLREIVGRETANQDDIRVYYDTLVWFNYNFRQSFGSYWTNLITGHVLMAWMVFPMFLIQIIRVTISGCLKKPDQVVSGNKTECCTNGDKLHRIVGGILLGLLAILWSCGGIAGAIIIIDRGFHPCSQTMQYNKCKQNVPNSATSFSFYLYLQFVYDGALISECLLHGMAARLFRDLRRDNGVKKWHIRVMNFLSLSCIYLYILRTGTAIGIITAYFTNRRRHYAGLNDKDYKALTELQNSWSPANLAKEGGAKDSGCLIAIGQPVKTAEENPVFMCMGQNGCAGPSNFIDAAPGISVAIVMLLVYLLEILVIPWINIGNILFTSEVWARAFRGKLDGKVIKKESADYSHGANLYACAFVVLWTFMANVGFVVGDYTGRPANGSIITFGAYAVLLIGLLGGWYVPVWTGKRPHSPYDVYFRVFRTNPCCKKYCCRETEIDIKVWGKDFKNVSW